MTTPAQAHAFRHADRLLAEILEVVSIESPSHDSRCVNRAVDWVENQLQRAGVPTTRVRQTAAGDQLIARLGNAQRRTLLLGHVDTVWDEGQLSRMPVRVEQGKAYGPGIFDMKAGVVLMVELFRMAAQQVCSFGTGLVAFFNSDEEAGSKTSRAILEELALECGQVFVFEPSLPGGRVKTFRKGVGSYRLEILGKAAHAAIDPAAGISAIEEFAHQVFSIQSIVAAYPNCTVNIGVVRGGTRSNVVPELVEAEIDVRLGSVLDGEAIGRRLHALPPHLPGAIVRVTGGINRPPLERSAGVVRLFEEAAAVAALQGWSLQEGATGGGSDGSFSAALGVSTLDGLGPDGDGAHAIEEHIVVEDVPRRLALAAGLLERLR